MLVTVASTERLMLLCSNFVRCGLDNRNDNDKKVRCVLNNSNDHGDNDYTSWLMMSYVCAGQVWPMLFSCELW